MSTFDNPFDPKRTLNSSGCSCGRHVSQAEHERDAIRQDFWAAFEAFVPGSPLPTHAEVEAHAVAVPVA